MAVGIPTRVFQGLRSCGVCRHQRALMAVKRSIPRRRINYHGLLHTSPPVDIIQHVLVKQHNSGRLFSPEGFKAILKFIELHLSGVRQG